MLQIEKRQRVGMVRHSLIYSPDITTARADSIQGQEPAVLSASLARV